MDVFPKFIVEGDSLILCKCTYHKDIATDTDKLKGGGWFFYKSDENVFQLHGSSHDFGAAKIEDIKTCIENKQVFLSRRRHFDTSDLHGFEYKNPLGEITVLKEAPIKDK